MGGRERPLYQRLTKTPHFGLSPSSHRSSHTLAIAEARQTRRPLYLLFVRPLPVLTAQDYKRKWQEDAQAREIFLEAKSKAGGHPVFPCYAVSDSVADTIVDITATMGVSYLILGASERKGLAQLLRGSIIRQISDNLPDDIHLLVYA